MLREILGLWGDSERVECGNVVLAMALEWFYEELKG